MKKKLLSLALALVLCLSLLPTAALADWENAKEVKNYQEYIAALEDEKVEEIKIVGDVTIPAAEEPLWVRTPTLIAKEGKLTMAPDAVMFVHVPMGRFNFEDADKTWDLVSEMCEAFIMWHPDEDTYNRDIFGSQPDINQQVKDAGGEPISVLLLSGDDVTLTADLSVETTLQIIGHSLTIAEGVKVEAGHLFVEGDLTMEKGASLTVGEGSGVIGKATFADESQKPANLEIAGEEEPAEEAPAAPANPFTDVAETSPFYNAILWAVDQGITNGTTPTTFGPGNTCTVSHILTFLWRANGRPDLIEGGAPEGAADRDMAAYWAIRLGMISQGDNVDVPCTRAAAATYMWIAAGKPEVSSEKQFTDVAADADCAAAVAWAVKQGVTTGTGDGTTFSPGNTCTRGQIVTFLYRAANS